APFCHRPQLLSLVTWPFALITASHQIEPLGPQPASCHMDKPEGREGDAILGIFGPNQLPLAMFLPPHRHVSLPLTSPNLF
ncbi:hypothetical protein PanWU01x14_127720, partial [Parasponia andersonii]